MATRQERALAAQALLRLVSRGRANKVIEDFQLNETGGKRAGQRYQTILTDGGNVIHEYANGERVFVRKQPRVPSAGLGGASAPVSRPGTLPVGTGFDMTEDTTILTPPAILERARRRRQRRGTPIFDIEG